MSDQSTGIDQPTGTIFVFVLVIGLLLNIVKVLPENKRAILFRLGRLAGLRGPGFFLIFPFGIDRLEIIDLRTVAQAKSSKEVLVSKIGLAITDINPKGKFFVWGEYWDAQTNGVPLKTGDTGQVTDVRESNPKSLIVEKLKQ